MEQVPKIVQQRLRSAARPGAHPDANMLSAFSEKLLGEGDRTQVLGHLAECAVCRETVALANAAKGEAPEASAVPAARPGWLTWPALRWGALAACVVVVGTAVTLHYEWRPEERPHAAAEISAPAASPPTVLLESRDAGELHEKLAAKIPPTLPYQSERDRAMAGKLAREPGATNGRTDDYAVMDRLQAGRAGANAPAADQVTRNALANSISVTAGAANVRQKAGAAGSAPAPVPATAPLSPPGAKTAGAEEAKQRDDVSKVGPVTETVTVEAEAPQMATESASVKPVDKSAVNKSVKDKEANQAQKAPARMVGGMGLADRKADMARAETTTAETTTPLTTTAETVSVQSKKSMSRAGASAAPRWTLSPEGGLQRSIDSGRTWQTVPLAQGVVFRALAANDADIWAGGNAGVLYHSSDAGQHWTQITPRAGGRLLAGDIIAVEFADPQHGKVTTSNHESWITSDGGQSWRVE
jgi:Photosynthesis system II assembly factor YCF48